jgi:Co/Zn/Cd efflux system component
MSGAHDHHGHHHHGADDCCAVEAPPSGDGMASYRRALGIVLALNATMFAVEIASGLAARSVALQADALDFLGDAFAYGMALAVLGMPLRWRAGVALFKGLCMGGFGLWVIGTAALNAYHQTVPEAFIMGWVGFAALLTNASCAVILYRHRQGDANMRSVWLCTRNDAIGNIAVVCAGLAVGLTDTGWPDYLVAAVMASLALSASVQVLRLSLAELSHRPA